MSLIINLAFTALITAANAPIPGDLKGKIDAVVAGKNKAQISAYMDETLKNNPQHYEALVVYWQSKISEIKQPAPAVKTEAVQTPVVATQSDRLKEAISIALESNPLVKKAEADLAATEQNENQAIARFLPQVNADLSYGRQRNAQGGQDWRNSDINDRGINLVQPLFRGGGNIAGYDRAQLQIKNAELESNKVKQAVTLEAAVAYVDLVSDWQLYQLSISNEDFLQKNMDIMQDRFNLGEVSNTDLAQSKTRLALAKANRLKSQNRYIASKSTFEKTVGSQEFIAKDLSAEISLPTNMPASLEDAISMAQSNNIDIKQAENEFLISEEEVNLNFADALPNLNLEASMRREEESGLLAQEYDSDRVMLKLNIPIFKGGENVSKISQAKRLVTSKEFELRDTKNKVEEKVKSLWDIHDTSRETIDASKVAYDASLVSLEGVRREEELGIRSVIDVLDAEEERITAQSNLIAAQRDQLRNAYQIMNLINYPLN